MARTAYYSQSRITIYRWCPWWYNLHYNAHRPEPPRPPGINPLVVGSAHHHFMAAYNQHLIETKQPTDLGNVPEIFHRAVVEAREAINPFSHSSKRNVLVDHMSYTEAKVISYRYAEKYMIDRPEIVAGIEQPLEMDVRGRRFAVVLDRWDIEDDTSTIWDYKTDRAIQKEVKHDIQLRAYAAAVFEQMPYLEEITSKKIFTRYGVERTTQVYPDEVYEIKEELFYYIDRIENEEKWEPTPGLPQCTMCPYVSMCPVYKDIKDDDDYSLVCRTEDDAQRIVGELALLERLVNDHKMALRAWINMHGAISHGKYKYDFITVKRENVDLKKFTAMCEKVGIDPYLYMTVDSHKKRGKKWAQLKERLGSDFEDIASLTISTMFKRVNVKEDEEEEEPEKEQEEWK